MLLLLGQKKLKLFKRLKDTINSTDGNAYGIRECKTINETFDGEINKLLNKWKI